MPGWSLRKSASSSLTRSLSVVDQISRTPSRLAAVGRSSRVASVTIHQTSAPSTAKPVIANSNRTGLGILPVTLLFPPRAIELPFSQESRFIADTSQRLGVTVARILLVEDDPSLARGLSATLRASGYATDIASDGEAAWQMASDEPYALITLDLGLPEMSGLEVLRKIRAAGNKVPVLILTARDALEDRLAGLDSGADDYMLKPFEPSELEARIRALLRRASGEADPVQTIGRLTIDTARATVAIDGRAIDLRRREWAVLERLAARVGKVVDKDRLSAEVFGYDEAVAPNAIEVYVARLRRKLEPDGPRIRTIRGLGYVLDAQ
ncbi:MAG: response regulator transcription factor [Sphingomonas sp.]|nr:response regulator transcription factor [Sphingomonas sp.]